MTDQPFHDDTLKGFFFWNSRHAVRLGEHKLSTEQDCDANNKCSAPVQDILIEKATKHEKYSNAKKINDIAILRLATPADTTKRGVKTICLPTSADNQLDKIDESARKTMLIAGNYDKFFIKNITLNYVFCF